MTPTNQPHPEAASKEGGAVKLTKAQRKAMEWVKANEPVSLFPCDGSAPDMRFVTTRLTKLGFVENVGTEGGRLFGFSKFALTEAGRAALSPEREGGADG